MSYADLIAAQARLHILKELHRQTDGRLNDMLVRGALDIVGIQRSRDFVRTQLRKLEELGAIELTVAGEMLIAHLAPAGRDHIAERSVIEGIARPSDVE